MEVVAVNNAITAGSATDAGKTSDGRPYQHRGDVREWSRLDRLTGMLERARIQTDQWAASTRDSTHKYGKVVDSRDRSAPDGNLQQRERKQLEVFQSRTPGGSLQVIRTQTISSSSSRWSSSGTAFNDSRTITDDASNSHDFENLQLTLNPLDLSSQKSRANVGRSGSIGTRRPPSRPRSIVGKVDPDNNLDEVTSSLTKVSRLCQKIHDDAIKDNFTKTSGLVTRATLSTKQNGETNGICNQKQYSADKSHSHKALSRTKSSSTEDLANGVPERDTDNCEDDLEQNLWRRTSRLRRSLQCPKQNKSETHKTVEKSKVKNSDSSIKEDIETGRRLNTAFRGNSVDLDALDQILQTISPSASTYSDINSSINNKRYEIPERDLSDLKKQSENLLKPAIIKQNSTKSSFVTAESLREVRGRLRRLSSPVSKYYEDINKDKSDEDDGIVTESNSSIKMNSGESSENINTDLTSKVRSYVFGMETVLNRTRKPTGGTGSLESRTSNKNSNNGSSRTEDWYNRRKSYGFEQVHSQQIEQSNSISSLSKNKVESSTDSGICRSSEIVVVPTSLHYPYSDKNIEIKYPYRGDDSNTTDSTEYGNNRTILTNIKNTNKLDPYTSVKAQNELNSAWNKFASCRTTGDDSQEPVLQNANEIKPVTITIPIVSKNYQFDNIENNKKNDKFYANENAANKNYFNNKIIVNGDDASTSRVNIYQEKSPHFNEHDLKRHSIAADEYNYTRGYISDNKLSPLQLRRTSCAVSLNGDSSSHAEDDVASQQGKKHKKVEFCKTEVHFAAESGRVNIVETDEKPPPTQNFRRRRRTSGISTNSLLEEANKNGLPLTHFGDNCYDKDPIPNLPDTISVNENKVNVITQEKHVSSTMLASANNNIEQEDDNQPRGILKNKPIKPKPYHLGEQEFVVTDGDSEDSSVNPWGVRLRSTVKHDNQMWHSTVTLRNTSYDTPENVNTEINCDNKIEKRPTEFQRILKTLRSVNDRFSDSNSSSPVDIRRASWSVADRNTQIDDIKWSENKGYSTTVSFSASDAKVITKSRGQSLVNVFEKNEKHPSLTKQKENKMHDVLNGDGPVLNKALVVRIGKEQNGTVFSTSSHKDKNIINSMTVTIDASESENSDVQLPVFNPIKLPRATLNTLKSTSLIMSTIKKPQYEKDTDSYKQDISDKLKLPPPKNCIPNQLEVLKKMYEDAGEHSDDSEKADEEVRSYMSVGDAESDATVDHDDKSSIVSGSWSKMRAIRNMKQQQSFVKSSNVKHSVFDVFANNSKCEGKNNCTQFLKKDNSENLWKKSITSENSTLLNSTKRVNDKDDTYAKKISVLSDNSQSAFHSGHKSLKTSQYTSPSISHELSAFTKTNSNLSSPLLIGTTLLNKTKSDNSCFNSINKQSERTDKNKTDILPTSTKKESFHQRIDERVSKRQSSPLYSYKRSTDRPLNKSSVTTSVKTSSKFRDKTDDIHSGKNKMPVYENHPMERRRNQINSETDKCIEKNNIRKIRRDSPIPNSERSSPIYENLSPSNSLQTSKMLDNETVILEELTRAADQILQAVNGYTDEESLKISTDEEEDGKKRKGQYVRKTADVLGTISETKSWKMKTQQKDTSKNTTVSQRNLNITKPRSGHNSSASSIESISRDCRKPVCSRQSLTEKQTEDKQKKKTTADTSSKSAKARRLQRASSREALLQSHGSSSEDVSITVETVRKPRPVRRLKTQSHTSATSDNTIEPMKKHTTSSSKVYPTKQSSSNLKTNRTQPSYSQEIRHKTAVSTIKNIADKPSNRIRAHKTETEIQKGHSQKVLKPLAVRVRPTGRNDVTRTTTHTETTSTGGNVLSSRVCSRSERTSRH